MTPPTVSVAGWEVSWLDTGAIWAPRTWVDPNADATVMAWLPSGALLCRRGADVILVDTGLGALRGSVGYEIRHVELENALASAGAVPEAVSVVVLTHLDSDHAGGTPGFRGNGMRHARVALLDLTFEHSGERSELAQWLETGLREASMAVTAVRDGGEVVPGMRLRSAPGHRAGHACVELSGDGERFIHLADVIHAREHVANPEWDFLHDSEPDVALDTRRVLLEELAGTETVVACSHVDSFGRIERTGDGGVHWIDLG